jgi:AcrR family transcriptional regulator
MSAAQRTSTSRQSDASLGRSAEADGRQRLIDAAVTCIIEEGFYRASSNAIADRAGVSWGVIQYHFGNRESLLLAVLQDGTRRLVDELSSSEIVGDTLIERIQSYFEILQCYYGDPRHLAYMQVMLNLSKDPKTSQETHDTVLAISEESDVQIKRLTSTLFKGTGIRNRTLRDLVFQVLRGVAISE